MATWDDLASLYDTGLVELGNHTYNMHASGGRNGAVPLSGESSDAYLAALRADLGQMQRRLGDICGAAPIAFVYPFGWWAKAAGRCCGNWAFQCPLPVWKKSAPSPATRTAFG